MSVLGYDPTIYYRGRSGIEAISMGIPVSQDEVAFRCNLVTVQDGKMLSYCAGHISSEEGRDLIAAVGNKLGSDTIHFYPGVGYRHICKLSGQEDTLQASCTPPHDIPNKIVNEYMPSGAGSDILRDLMVSSTEVLRDHPVNRKRIDRGEMPANMIWLFWGSGKIPELPPFRQKYGLSAALTSAVDLLRGLAKMANIDILDIRGVTDGLDNDYSAQAQGALSALETHDLVIIHVEAPDEAGHAASVDAKIEAIERVDSDVVGEILSWKSDAMRVLALPDHPTPIATQTHSSEPVPFVLWGQGVEKNGARRFNEAEAKGTGVSIDAGYGLMDILTGHRTGDEKQQL
jgi:2,3-bisphosphoglycerate-independent phosphoglycerate mutase